MGDIKLFRTTGQSTPGAQAIALNESTRSTSSQSATCP